jgi:hypothetical protein
VIQLIGGDASVLPPVFRQTQCMRTKSSGIAMERDATWEPLDNTLAGRLWREHATRACLAPEAIQKPRAPSLMLLSFNSFFEPFERGGGSTGHALASLPEATRRTVREEMRRALGDTGGPVEIDVEIRIARGRR